MSVIGHAVAQRPGTLAWNLHSQRTATTASRNSTGLRPGASTMGEIGPHVGKDYDLDNLDPITLPRGGSPHGNRHQPARRHCHADDCDAEAQSDRADVTKGFSLLPMFARVHSLLRRQPVRKVLCNTSKWPQ